MTIRILSIRQPWAYWIIHRGKDVENRTWSTKYRGPLLIHAGQSFDRTALDWMITAGLAPDSIDKEWPKGGIVGSVNLVDCVQDYDSPWFFGPYGFVLRDPQPLDFIPYRGQLGLFKPGSELLSKLPAAIRHYI